MDIELTVRTMLKNLKTAFLSKDFESYEDYEIAVEYLKNQELNGYVEFLDEKRESMTGLRRLYIVSVRVTDHGKEWLSL